MDNRKLILLVEDNPDDLELTLLALKRSNLCQDIVVPRDGQELLQKLTLYRLRVNLPPPQTCHDEIAESLDR